MPEEKVSIPTLEIEDYVPEDAEETANKDIHDDLTAIKWGVLGVGQCGGSLASAFYSIGYRRVLACNTSENDLNNLNLPDNSKLLMKTDDGGTGKNRELGLKAATKYANDIADKMKDRFGTVDRVLITASAGGGTGSGSIKEVARVAKVYAGTPATLMLVLPSKSSSRAELANTRAAINDANILLSENLLASVVAISNERALQIFPNVSTRKFFSLCNSNVVNLWHIWNILANQDSEYSSFDKKDFSSLLDSGGYIVFGVSAIKGFVTDSAIAETVRSNLTGGLLAGELDISTGKSGAIIIVGNATILDSVPQRSLEYANTVMSRLINNSGAVYLGIYEDDKAKLRVYTMIAGLSYEFAGGD